MTHGFGWLVAATLVACSTPMATPGATLRPAAVTSGACKIVWQEHFARIPSDWGSPSGASASDLSRVFSIADESGEPFLRAHHDARPNATDDAPPAVHFGHSWRRAPLRLDQACVLSWRWRVRRHPQLSGDPWQDVAASLYVITDPPGLLSRGRGFKLAWLSRRGPRGSRQRGLLQIAVRVGPASDTWRSQRVDLCALYEQHFGPVADEPLGYLGVVTDADDSESLAMADYDDLQLAHCPQGDSESLPHEPTSAN